MRLFPARRGSFLSPLRALCALAVLTLAFPLQARAGAERILSFDSRIEVRRDARLLVTETIRVEARGRFIKRGIYRDFPTLYSDSKGRRHRVDFALQQVLRDGRPEAHHAQTIKNGTRLYIGRKDVFLEPGLYEYTISYVTDRQLGFFKDHHELYWNVTGNGWEFIIEKASCQVILPDGAAENLLETDAYTGPQGAKGKDFETERRTDGSVVFRTTRTLAPAEGLTVVVSWPKGYVKEPTPADRKRYFLRDYGSMLRGGAVLAVLLAYYLFVWYRVGRDPQKSTIIPLFHPPKGLSAASTRYIVRKGYDPKIFAVALTSAAVKQHVKIIEKKGVFSLQKAEEKPSTDLSDDEKIALEVLGEKEACKLDSTRASFLIRTAEKLKIHLSKSYEKVYFVMNLHWFGYGILLSILLGVAIAFWPGAASSVSLFFGFWISFWGAFTLAMCVGALQCWRSARRGPEIARAVFFTAFALPFLAAWIFAIREFHGISGWPPLVFMAGMALINLGFYEWLKAPTLAGRKILDRIEGFRMFLSTTERDRLKSWDPPEDTFELYERFLPYAMALDVEDKWSRRFSSILTAHETSDGSYHPWYTGPMSSNFGSSFGSSLASTISSASSPPGSSSGGGGGGSSGGGGGGGGGGGW